MAELHITNIEYIEINDQEGIEFTYKPDVPKLKLVGTVFLADDESEEDDENAFVFLTQKQLNQLLANKEVDLKSVEDNRWQTQKPLTKEQIKKIGLVSLESEFLGNAGDVKCFEVTKVIS